MTTKCSVCNRPLKDPISVRLGKGPVCATRNASQKSFFDEAGTGSAQAIFEHGFFGDVLVIKDIGHEEARTVANNAENVLRTIQRLEPHRDLTKYRIIYCDSAGKWDGLRWDGTEVFSFYVGGETAYEAFKRISRT